MTTTKDQTGKKKKPAATQPLRQNSQKNTAYSTRIFWASAKAKARAKAKAKALPIIKIMAGAHAHVEPLERASRFGLYPIGSKRRAEEILATFDETKCTFARIKLFGIGELEPELLNIVFTPCRFYWDQIFIASQTERTVSAIIVSTRASESVILKYIAAESGGSIVYKESIRITLTIDNNINNFKSHIFSFHRTLEYRLEKPAAPPKRKIAEVEPEPPKRPAPQPGPSSKAKPVLKCPTSKQQSQPKCDQDLSIVKELPANNEFVPLTHETIECAVKYLQALAKQNRIVSVVFDPCFNLVNVNMDLIRAKLGHAFGPIDHNCVLIKCSLQQLAPDNKEACAREFSLQGQAYIIGPPNLTKRQLQARAAQSKILYGTMSWDCVLMDIKTGAYLVTKKALLCSDAPPSMAVDHPLPLPSAQAQKISVVKLKPKPKPVPLGKQKVEKPKTKKISLTGPENDEAFARLLMQKVGEDCERSEFVTSVLPKLTTLGNTVIRIENLLADVTADGLNLMMGTCSITCDQVVGVRLPRKKSPDLMNVRIVMQSNNKELEEILRKDGCNPGHGTNLLIRRTDFRELEKFLSKNYDKICKLNKTSNMSKPAVVSYGLARVKEVKVEN